MLAATVCVLTLAACGNKGSSAPIGIVDTQRMLQYWPAFQNDNNQLSVDMAAIERSHDSPAQKERARADLQGKYVRVQRELTDQVRQAAEQVAREKNLKLVVTREFVGYGGTDITPDVEKLLKIVETSPSASP